MLAKLNNKKADQKGFTIIEVMIVLAIAGLILLIVFLAVPALQRNSRNTQRKSDASHLLSLVNEYMTNNSGTPPTSITTSGSSTATALSVTDKFSIITVPTTVTATVAATSFAAAAAPTTDTPQVYTNAKCTNATTPVMGTSSRQVAIWYYQEGNTATQCIDS